MYQRAVVLEGRAATHKRARGRHGCVHERKGLGVLFSTEELGRESASPVQVLKPLRPNSPLTRESCS